MSVVCWGTNLASNPDRFGRPSTCIGDTKTDHKHDRACGFGEPREGTPRFNVVPKTRSTDHLTDGDTPNF